MSIFEKNYQQLEACGYQTLVKVLTSDVPADENLVYGVAEVADRNVLYAVKDGVEYQLDTLYDPEELLNMWASMVPFSGYGQKVIFCGVGNGMYARKTLSLLDDTGKLLLYEPSVSLFSTVIENFDLTDILSDSRVTLVVGQYGEKSAMESLYSFVTYEDIKNSVYQSYPNYDRLFPELVKEYDEMVQTLVMKLRATKSVLGRNGRRNAFNSITNTKKFALSKSIYDFSKRCPRNLPFIIIASGPSLNKNVEELKRAKGHAILCAVDSALPVLMEHDVIPDIFVTVDSKKSIHHTDDERVWDIPVICEMESKFEVLYRQKGPVFFMNDMNPYVNKYLRMSKTELPPFPSGGSVANSACAIADLMGFESIVFVGQDLAYTGDKTYADGTVGSKRKTEIDDENTVLVDGYYGGKVKSSREFFLYRDWFENEIKRNPAVHFYNATEGGAYIHGAEHLPLGEVIDRLCVQDCDMAQIIADTAPLFDEDTRHKFGEYMASLGEKLHKDREEIKTALLAYSKIMSYLAKNEMPMGQIKKLLDTASACVPKLEKDYAMYYVFCYAQAKLQEVEGDINDSEGNVQEDLRSVVSKGTDYLTILLQNVDALTDFFRKHDFFGAWLKL